MNEFKGTPGPWEKDGLHWRGSNGDIVVVSDGPSFGSKSSFPQAEPNSTLVKAAPDLKDALQKLVLLYEADEGCRAMPEYIGAIAALEKATSISN